VPRVPLEIGLAAYCATLFEMTEPLTKLIVPPFRKIWFEVITEGWETLIPKDLLSAASLAVKTPCPLKPEPPLALELFPVAEPPM